MKLFLIKVKIYKNYIFIYKLNKLINYLRIFIIIRNNFVKNKIIITTIKPVFLIYNKKYIIYKKI